MKLQKSFRTLFLALTLSVFTAVFCSVNAFADTENLLVHGDAEGGDTLEANFFYKGNYGPLDVVVDPDDETNHVFKMTQNGAGAYLESSSGSNPLTFEDYTEYEFSCRIKVDPSSSEAENAFRLYLYSGGYVWLTDTTTVPADGEWHTIKGISRPDSPVNGFNPGISTYEFAVYLGTAGCTAYLDDLTIKTVKSISTDKTFYAPGSNVVVKISPDVPKGSWLTILPAGITPSSGNYNSFVHYRGINYGAAPLESDVFTLPEDAAPGNYVIYYFPNGSSYTYADKIDIRIDKSLTVGKTSYYPGEKMEITYKNAVSSESTWVGVYEETHVPGDGTYATVWSYVPNEGDGTLTLITPTVAGNYVAFLVEGSNTVVDSAAFSVIYDDGITDESIPVTAPETSIRTIGEKGGIRFRASIGQYIVDNTATEIGFMVTRDTHFKEVCGDSNTNFVFANDALNVPKKLSTGIVYNVDDDIDLLQGDPASDKYTFTAVVVGIPENAEFYQEKLHIRAYVVCEGVTYYGNVQTKSLYEAAVAYNTAHPDDPDDFARNIIKLVEEA